ncbi:MAG: hypothetical protein PUF17_00580 [Lactimicrobium massiliense]|nr:hypothetical protein [Lactimicrobium massiliense]MDD6559449.1 hypothetical protein [Lactimicrobium massiliense]
MKTTISVNALLRRMAIEYIKMDDAIPVEEEEGRSTFRNGELVGFKKAMKVVEKVRNEKECRDRQRD